MLKLVSLLFVAAACSAQSFSYSTVTPYAYPYAYGAYPYGAYPYAYPAYAPLAKAYVASPYMAHESAVVAAPAVVAAAPAVVAAAPALVKTQYHAQDPMTGSASYGHIEAGQAHQAVQDAAGNKIGSFSHVLPDGSISRTDYVADALGYRVASNSLPINVAPLPAPVADTPEVVAARDAHLAEVEKVKSRSKRAIAYAAPYATPLAYTAPVAYSSHYPTYSPAYYTASPYLASHAAYAKYPVYY